MGVSRFCKSFLGSLIELCQPARERPVHNSRKPCCTLTRLNESPDYVERDPAERSAADPNGRARAGWCVLGHAGVRLGDQRTSNRVPQGGLVLNGAAQDWAARWSS